MTFDGWYETETETPNDSLWFCPECYQEFGPNAKPVTPGSSTTARESKGGRIKKRNRRNKKTKRRNKRQNKDA